MSGVVYLGKSLDWCHHPGVPLSAITSVTLSKKLSGEALAVTASGSVTTIKQ
jgi:hypothetical protein